MHNVIGTSSTAYLSQAGVHSHTYRETCVISPVEHGTSLQKLTAAIRHIQRPFKTQVHSKSRQPNRVRRYYGRLLMCKRTLYKRPRIPMFLWEQRACANSGAISSPPKKRYGNEARLTVDPLILAKSRCIGSII